MKKFLFSIIFFLSLAVPSTGFADSAVGDVIITLGSDLTEQQKQDLLKEMNAPENPQIVTVTNEEEHKYLGDYIPKAQIGSKAISSSKIQIEKSGSGLEVQTNNINWVTDEMYLNALMTAGVKDANVYVTAPFEVSGTAALTGLMKAYEVSTDQAIPEDVKKVANQELVETAKLGDKIGEENASALIAKVKEQLSENGVPSNDQELREMIENAAKDLNITLSDDDINHLMNLFNNMINVNIDWDQVGQQLDQAKEKISKFLESEEGQNFLQQLKDFFSSLIDSIASFFSGK